MVPSGWDLVEAQDICQRISVGIVVKPKDYYVPEGDGVRAFRSANVREGYVEDSNWTYISDAGHQKNKKSILQAGDVLVVRTGYPGTACVVPEQYAGANCIDIIFARPDQTRVLPEYLCDFTNSEYGKKQVLDGQGGLAQQHFNVGSYNRLRVPLPPLPEQRKIADILSTWDAVIEKTEALLATARTQKRALMQSLLTGRRRFPEFEGQPWKEVRFEEVFSRVRRKNAVGNDNVLTISAQHGLVSQEKYFNKRVAAKDLSGYTLLHHGDFAYNKSYSQGYPLGAIKMLEVDEPGVVSSLYLCFSLTDRTAHSREFFRHFFEAGQFNREVYKIAQEGARNHGLLNVSAADFFRARLRIPELEEQKLIARAIGSAEVEEEVHRRELKKLRIEKKALTQQLLTGKRRVKI